MLLNSQTRSLASLLIHHPFRPTKAPHCQSDLEIHRHCNIAHPQIVCIIVVLKVLKLLREARQRHLPMQPSSDYLVKCPENRD